MNCEGCYHFHSRYEYLGYCDLMDYVVSVNGECDDWEEEEEEE